MAVLLTQIVLLGAAEAYRVQGERRANAAQGSSSSTVGQGLFA